MNALLLAAVQPQPPDVVTATDPLPPFLTNDLLAASSA